MSDAAGTLPSRRRWLIVVVAVSIALNLFFIGMVAGHFRHRHRLAPLNQRERFERIAADLKMSDPQRAAFQRFQTILRANGAAMRAANAAAWARIADPETSTDQISELLNSTVKNRNEFQQDVANAMGKFLASLTPAQRANFIDEARNTPHPQQ
jgi:uncharacterized membrane protein